MDTLLWDALSGTIGAAARLRDVLEPRARAAAARELFVLPDLQGATAALGAAGVPVLITKGTALAYTAYPHAWLRPRTDTDLLVSRADVPPATRALENCGYRRSAAVSTGELVSHQIAFERTDPHGVHHVIDLHWKIVNPQIVADALTFADLWSGARGVPALGAAVRVPSPVASIALGCVHRLAHHQGDDRLIWLYDLKLLASSLGAEDWTRFEDLACRQLIAGFCLDGLRTSRVHFATVIPATVEDALAGAMRDEPSKAYAEGPVSKRDVLLSDLALLGSWRERVRLVKEHAFPSPAFMQQRYGTSRRWALPALYVHRLVTGASKWVRQ
ncbi:MAG: nucleotidyltransferase family protein [Acidobacteria bacterium]|nr:nucleotidyltransferase family protein [Acidobacteriota bacterium]